MKLCQHSINVYYLKLILGVSGCLFQTQILWYPDLEQLLRNLVLSCTSWSLPQLIQWHRDNKLMWTGACRTQHLETRKGDKASANLPGGTVKFLNLHSLLLRPYTQSETINTYLLVGFFIVPLVAPEMKWLHTTTASWEASLNSRNQERKNFSQMRHLSFFFFNATALGQILLWCLPRCPIC